MPLIEFVPVERKELVKAKFFSDQEKTDFADAFIAFREFCESSYLFKDIDFESLYDQMMESAKAKHFDGRGMLKEESLKGINSLYASRFDTDAFYDAYLK